MLTKTDHLTDNCFNLLNSRHGVIFTASEATTYGRYRNAYIIIIIIIITPTISRHNAGYDEVT